MKAFSVSKKRPLFLLPVVAALIIVFLSTGPVRAGEAPGPGAAELPKAETLRLGERMYREGVLPSGQPMKAVVKGDIPVAGTAFTCMSCHLRSGLGSVEGGVITPATNGKNLYQPIASQHKYYAVSAAPPVRPAYTDKTLADALRAGIDPRGRKLSDVMPRYMLDDKDMAALIAYLKSLSSDHSPGVTDDAIRFATVVTDDADPEARDAMLKAIEQYFTYKNNMAAYYKTKGGRRSARMAESMLLSREIIYKQLLLSLWELKGAPETWRGQLEEYNRREPVFALINGISKDRWRPIHRFCEDRRIPCILPITEFPVISDTDWYTLYFSKGLYQEGVAAARYLGGLSKADAGGKIVQIVAASPSGRALSAGFGDAWLGPVQRPFVRVALKEGEALTKESLARILEREKPSILVVWDGPASLPALEALADSPNRPRQVFLSSTYLGKALWEVKDKARGFIYFTYPFRLPGDEARYTKMVESFMGIRGLKGEGLIVLKQVYSTMQVLSQVLAALNGNYYRDYLLDLFGMTMSSAGMGLWEQDTVYPLYERFSFGPGQRYASKGCYIVQLSKGPSPELLKKSDWAIQ
ncbi:MAG: c-type cytochrome [Nitrospiraceae bacterium]|nr:c-type cytochrome [Nitrospiraceae bacterium]